MSNSKKEEFYQRWMRKVDYCRGYNSSPYNSSPEDRQYQVFDEFIALFIVYNFLYVEAYQCMQRENSPEVSKNKTQRFPDEKAATSYIIEFLDGAKKSCEIMQLDENYLNDDFKKLQELINRDRDGLIIQKRPFQFNICLNPFTGEADLKADKELADKLLGRNQHERALAVLKVIYQVRCNLFHGRKGLNTPNFGDVTQISLLQPLCNILRNLVEHTFTILKEKWQ